MKFVPKILLPLDWCWFTDKPGFFLENIQIYYFWIRGYLANLSSAVGRVHNLQRAFPLCQIALKSIHLVIYNSASCLKLSINLLTTIHILIRLLNAFLFDKAL